MGMVRSIKKLRTLSSSSVLFFQLNGFDMLGLEGKGWRLLPSTSSMLLNKMIRRKILPNTSTNELIWKNPLVSM